jgi:hypothetical protein
MTFKDTKNNFFDGFSQEIYYREYVEKTYSSDSGMMKISRIYIRMPGKAALKIEART